MIDWSGIFSEVRFSAVRSRGPGGQNVNKVASAALAFWPVAPSNYLSGEQKSELLSKLVNTINKEGEVFLRSDEFRDLERNKARCLEKLKLLILQALHKPKKRRPTRPTKASRVRKRESKSRRSEIKKGRQKVRF